MFQIKITNYYRSLLSLLFTTLVLSEVVKSKDRRLILMNASMNHLITTIIINYIYIKN